MKPHNTTPANQSVILQYPTSACACTFFKAARQGFTTAVLFFQIPDNQVQTFLRAAK